MNYKLNNIKKYRKENGATIIDIARATGLTRKAIYEVENGRTLPRSSDFSEAGGLLRFVRGRICQGGKLICISVPA